MNHEKKNDYSELMERRLLLLSDPIICGKELAYICKWGVRALLCVSSPKHRKMDAIFLKRGRLIRARGRPEVFLNFGCDNGTEAFWVFRILERELLIK